MTSIEPKRSFFTPSIRTKDDRRRHRYGALTLIELLVVVSIIALLVSILLPSLKSSRSQTKSVKCLSQLRVLGQGLAMYSMENGDVFVPSRMPKVDDCSWVVDIAGGPKYRPTFLSMMSVAVGVPPFEDPKTCKTQVDVFGENGDRQNYSSRVYVCPTVPDWTDERNSSYGYNYHFLGNSRLREPSDIRSFKNWPIVTTLIRAPAATVAVGDSMGTAAGFERRDRGDYDGNSREPSLFGNEGFNLDPPRIDLVAGEIAEVAAQRRTAADPRHNERANVLWVDAHADPQTPQKLGYRDAEDGSVGLDGSNAKWTGSRRDLPWTPGFTY